MRVPTEHQQWFGVFVLSGIIIVQAYLLAFVPIGTPRTGTGWEFETADLADGVAISQTFRVLAAGLNEVTLYPAPASNPPAGDVRVSLSRLGHNGHLEDKRLARERRVAASELVADSSWTFRFPSVPDSNDEYFQIELRPERDSRGVRLIAVAGEDAYPAGALMVAGLEMPADLRFNTGALADTAAERLVARFTGRQFSTVALVAAFALMSGGLVAFLRVFLRALEARC